MLSQIAFPMNNAEIRLFFFIPSASSSWQLSHRLLCNCEYDNMTVIHRCQNMTSRANLCSRCDKVRTAELEAPGDFHEDTYIQQVHYLYHAAANSNNLVGWAAQQGMQMDEKKKKKPWLHSNILSWFERFLLERPMPQPWRTPFVMFNTQRARTKKNK